MDFIIILKGGVDVVYESHRENENAKTPKVLSIFAFAKAISDQNLPNSGLA